MFNKISIIPSTFLLCISCNGVEEDSLNLKDIGFSKVKIDRMVSEINKHVDNGEIAGIQTAVLKNGQLVNFNTYGYADVEEKRPLEENSIFRIYSMTKPIVSVGLMMLYEKNMFNLDDPVSKFIPEFENIMVYNGKNNLKPINQIKIIDLLRHSSGYGYGWSDNKDLNSFYEGIWNTKDNQEFINKILTIPLFSSPDTEWRYGVNTDICGYLIEVISGKSLDNFLFENIFVPLEMKDTHFKLPDDKINRFVSNYSFDNDSKKLKRIDKYNSKSYSNVTWFSGGGGLVSTTKDYIKFTLSLLGKKKYNDITLLSDKTLRLMTKNHIDHLKYPWGEGIGFGLGFSVVTDYEKTELLDNNGTFGWSGMAGTIFSVDPEEELILIMMIQRNFPWGNAFSTFNKHAYESLIN